MKAYKLVIKFLFNNYCGLYYVVIFNKVYNAVRASRILTLYLIIYGIFTIIFEGENNPFSLVDLIFTVLLIPQFFMIFTSLLSREYMRIFSLTAEDLNNIDKERQQKAYNKIKNNNANIAQSVERLRRNQEVVGSMPSIGSIMQV